MPQMLRVSSTLPARRAFTQAALIASSILLLSITESKTLSSKKVEDGLVFGSGSVKSLSTDRFALPRHLLPLATANAVHESPTAVSIGIKSQELNPDVDSHSSTSTRGTAAGSGSSSRARSDGGDPVYPGEGSPKAPIGDTVLPGQRVAAFSVDTLLGSFHYNPDTSELPVIVILFNPLDLFQKAMWSAPSLQMFLRHAPLAAADYLFFSYTYSPVAAADLAYYMYGNMIAAAREVYGSDDTTDEDLRRRVLAHIHFATTPAYAVSAQVLLLMNQWTQTMKVLHARVTCGSPPPSPPPLPPPPSAVPVARISRPTAGVSLQRADTVAMQDARRSVLAATEAMATIVEETRNHVAVKRVRAANAEKEAEADAAARTLAAAAATVAPGSVTGPEGVPVGLQVKERLSVESSEVHGKIAMIEDKAEVKAPQVTATDKRIAAEEDGLTVGRLDAWYGWLPSPATAAPSPAPLVAFDDDGDDGGVGGSRGRQSPCDPVDGGGRFSGSWVLVNNASRDDFPACTYGDIVLNLQRMGALGVIFSASPNHEVEVIVPDDNVLEMVYEAVYPSSIDDPQRRELPLRTSLSRQQQQQKILMSRSRARSLENSAVGPMMPDDGGYGAAVADGDGSGGDGDVPDLPCIPVTMVSYSDGLDLLMLLGKAAHDTSSGVEVEFSEELVPIGWFTIDPWVGLAEAGWAKLPLMMHAGWAAWWHVYLGRLHRQLLELQRQSAHSRFISVFKDEPFPGTATVSLPRNLPRRFHGLLLDFSLDCPGHMDASCPFWDHMVQLFACCDPHPERCRQCPTTLWRRAQGAAVLKLAEQEGGPQEGQRCGLELGRWATPFRRRVGRWLTDVTPLIGLLGDGGRCSFTIQTAPWADGNWTTSLSLVLVPKLPPSVDEPQPHQWEVNQRQEQASTLDIESARLVSFSNSRAISGEAAQQEQQRQQEQPEGIVSPSNLQPKERISQIDADGGEIVGVSVRSTLSTSRSATPWSLPRSLSSSPPSPTSLPHLRALTPVSVLPLFDSAVFDSSYNQGRAPFTFTTPRGLRAAAVVSYITGHGSDAVGCGEFCPISHHLFINGLELAVLNFTNAGTAWGCADAVLYGVVPNQHGTWFYGRGGWCDGARVEPWVVDVSELLWPPGSMVNNTIWLKGLYGNGNEPMDSLEHFSAGYIMMQSLLVLYQ